MSNMSSQSLEKSSVSNLAADIIPMMMNIPDVTKILHFREEVSE
jgi:hypothetical protein